jgi:hypothetical protein
VGRTCSRDDKEKCVQNLEILLSRDDFREVRVEGRIILKRNLKKQSGSVWPGSRWLRMKSGGGLL